MRYFYFISKSRREPEKSTKKILKKNFLCQIIIDISST